MAKNRGGNKGRRKGGQAPGRFGQAVGAEGFPSSGGRGGGGDGGSGGGGGRGRDGGRGGRDQGRQGGDRRDGRQPDGRATTRDPIDVITGEVLLSGTDLRLPGVLTFALERTHISSYRDGRLFGRTWASTLDQRLEPQPDGVLFLSADAMILKYPHAGLPNVRFLPAEGPQWPLVLTSDGGYTLTDPETCRILHFPAPGEEHGWSSLPLVAISDRNGNRVDLVYEDRVLVEIRHSGGYRVAVDTAPHDGGERRVTALRLHTSDTGGQAGGVTVVRYGYDGAGHLSEIIDSSGRPLRLGYDAEGRLIGWHDRNDHWYRYDYDEQGRAVRAAGSDGILDTSLVYEPDAHRTLVSDALGHVTTYVYNDALQVVSQVDPLGGTSHFEWDRFDRMVAHTDPLGHTTRYSYDDEGNLTELVRPDGARAAFAYGGPRLPVEITDAGGNVWHHEYDERGNLTRILDPAGSTVGYAYDERGHLVAVTDPHGQTTRMEVNAAGLPVAVTDPLNAVTRFAHDAFGRVSSVTDPLGGVTRFGWTPEGRPAWRALPDETVESWSYDPEGNLTEYVDGAGRVTRTEFTAFGTPVAEIGPDGARLEFGHDGELRLTKVVNPQGLTWTYDYDAGGRVVAETDFNGRTVSYAYDAAGLLSARTNALGQTVTFTRDVLGHVAEKHVDGARTVFERDASGRLLRAANDVADLRFDRDPMGRVVAERCNGAVVSSAYDRFGRRVRRRTPSGAESTWTFDPAGQPAALATSGQTITFAHDAAGREVQRRIGHGTILAQQWDATHQLSTQTLWGAPVAAPAPGAQDAGQPRLLQHRAYAYRGDGAVTGIADRLNGDRRLDVDAAGRIVAVRAQGWTERYAYDPTGNLTHADWPVVPPGTSVNGRTGTAPPAGPGPDANADAVGAREHSGTLIRRAGNVRYEHDAQGRIVLRQRARPSSTPLNWRYQWDADDRLVGVETPDGSRWRYRYDALGRRASKQRLAADGRSVLEQVDFAWDDDVVAEQIHNVWSPERRAWSTRCTVWEYEPESYRPLAQTERVPARDASQRWIDERFHAIVTDLVGAPAELVDVSGEVVWRSRTTVWGAKVPAPTSGVDCPLGFPGQYRDPETGLSYNHHRYYDPISAGYASGDPIGLAGGFNPHAYVANPLGWMDPLGLRPKGPPEKFERYGSQGEAEASKAAGGLVPRPGHERQPKWIADKGVVDPRTLGKRQNYTHYIEMHADPGTKQWLKDQGYEIKPTNEPDRYAVPESAREEFNERVRKVEIRRR
ncbi:RHS repeat-associated core domain-containing protein [Spirillospora sp. NPDC047279]|uniref:RHS repeat-associated core domain-containing protein n=1 Tax=Spirillospora sp. NPDC047279 TaxID=3155478 RepID=UPI0034031685